MTDPAAPGPDTLAAILVRLTPCAWRPYKPEHPHMDRCHVEDMCWDQARHVARALLADPRLDIRLTATKDGDQP